jgi:uncharacterized protein YndB with AHSA1/START domain
MTSKVEDQTLIMERTFDAPRELVFKVFSDPTHLAHWWGPKGWHTEIRQFDFKPNGIWHYCMRCTDKNQGEFYGQESWCKAVYQEIIEPEKIVCIDTFTDQEGNAIEGMPEMLITLTFLEFEGKTKLINHTRFASAEALKFVLDMGMIEGMAESLDRLAYLLQELQ